MSTPISPSELASMNPIDDYKPITDTDFFVPKGAKLDPEVKQQWLDYLRGGDFKQVTGGLKNFRSDADDNLTDEIGYCCLGVLCEVAVKNSILPESVREKESGRWVPDPNDDDDDEGHWEEWPEEEAPALPSWAYAAGYSDMPPSSVYDWSGLSIHVAKYLAHKNDDGATFGEIADFIEREL